MENIELEKFLPTAEEVEKMNNDDLSLWISKASREIPLRAVERHPLTHLRKRIISTLQQEGKSEAVLEREVYELINDYRKRKFENFIPLR